MDTTIVVWATATTAAATVVLAVATLVYVRKTSEAVTAARDSAKSARASVLHAARAIDATERSTLAQAMPLLITQWAATTEMGEHVTIDFTVHNVGKSTALNGHLFYADGTKMLLPLAPGYTRRLRNMPGEIVDGEGRPVGDITIEYQDAIGNELRTHCSTTARENEAMYRTSLRDGRRQLRAAEGALATGVWRRWFRG